MPEERSLQPAAPPEELGITALEFHVAPDALGFRTTDDIQLDGDWFGQERALAALELGLRVRHAGFNVYVCGLTGTHRQETLAALLRDLTASQPSPGDRVLVQNFHNPDRPRAFDLGAGEGVRLRDELRELVSELRRVLPETFRRETFEAEKESLTEKYGSQGEEIQKRLAERAAEAGFSLQPGPGDQLMFIPVVGDRPMTPEEVQNLTDDQREELTRKQRDLQREIKAGWRQHRALLRDLSREVKAAERRVAQEVLNPLVEEIAQRFSHDHVRVYLNDVRDHVLENLASFREQQPQPPMPFLMGPVASPEEAFLDYEVNVLVDNSGLRGAPVIVETWPTYKNLFGAIERIVDRYGKLVTNFTRVIAGSLLRAHGGCIVINLLDALSEPLVWRSLKQCLKTSELEIEAYDPFALFATSALRPEPMSLDVRVLLTGPTYAFQMLYWIDDEFRDIFKVRADFGFEAEGREAEKNFYAQVARIARTEKLGAFTAAAVARLKEQAARVVGDRRKLPSQWSEVADLMREASFWAHKHQRDVVDAAEVEQSISQRSFRQNRVEEKIRELIRDRSLLVDVDGARIGQVNGLAVMDLIGYQFGRPSRITATVSVGTHGVVAVDREAKLSGPAYDKAVFIITGYLRHKYAQKFPLSLAASLSFEQSYSGIEGDSASAAELCALISSLSGVPLRQDIAVTGSLNQFGDIQPIGGVNEKIEGFFYVCREIGLTGKQGVIIPAQNAENLVPSQDVVEAVKEGRFHIYPIRHLDEGLEILTGMKAGDVHEEGTLHHAAYERLQDLAKSIRRFGAQGRRPAPEKAEEKS